MASVENVMDHSQEIQQAAFEAKKQEIERERVFGRLKELKVDIKQTLDHCHDALEHTSGILVDYFRRIPDHELSEQIAQRFRMWDIDNSGALDRNELTEALAELGKRPTAETMDEFMKTFDLDGNGTIELDEFEHMVRSNIAASTAHCSCHLCKSQAQQDETPQGESEGPEAEGTGEAVIKADQVSPINLTPISASALPSKKGSVNNTPRRVTSNPTPRCNPGPKA